MTDHRYKVGQTVAILPATGLRAGVAKVVKLMPASREDLEPQYRVKSTTENHERMVMESGIRAAE